MKVSTSDRVAIVVFLGFLFVVLAMKGYVTKRSTVNLTIEKEDVAHVQR